MHWEFQKKTLLKCLKKGENDMLEVKNLEKNYKSFSLKKVSFSLEEGCVMGLIGKNGSGKTTLISCILNLVIKSGGVCTVFQTENNLLTSEQKEDIGVVFDEIHFPEKLKVKEVGQFCRFAYKNWDKEKFNNFLIDYDLNLNKKIYELSKGMKMKLQLAVAFSHNPKLLILDEATSGLDPIVRDELLDYIFEFVRDGKHSVLISSHILSDIEKVADVVTYIDDGKILISDYKDNLIEKYCIIKGGDSILNNIAKSDILGVKHGEYGIEACVLKDSVKNMNYDKVTLEDIMIFSDRKDS